MLWFFYAFYTIYLLIRTYFVSSGIKRDQIKYILIGTIIGYLGGATNYLLWYNIPIPPIGNWSTTFYLGLVAYAIVKYRLMDIRLVLGRTMIYLFSFASVIALTFLLIFLNNKTAKPLPFNVAGPLVIIINILLFQFLFKVFEIFASRYFYYTFYNSQKVLTDLGKRLTQVLDLDKLSSLIANTLLNTLKLERIIILLKESEINKYQIKKNIGFKQENGASLVKDNFLTTYLEKTQKPLVYEEISLIIKNTPQEEEKKKLQAIQTSMKRIKAALCLPLLIENKINGMIVLGNKISGDSFSVQDIDLLTHLSNQASIALQNARLYFQVKDLSKNLEKKVKEQTEKLQKAYEELKVLDEAKSEFISMASHQLRTPLSAIKGYISMMIDGSYGHLPKKMKEKLQNVFYSNERLIKVVNDLLNISRIEIGKMELTKEKIYIQDLIQSCYEEMKIEAEKKKLKFIFEKPKKSLPQIEVDSLKIRQVLLNLIDNAIRYTQKGEIIIKAESQNSKIKIMIKDTGEGLSDKEQKNIFESFRRGSAGITYFIEGAGLGLYVAKKFLDLHHGKIWAESEGKGKGSAFYIELPAR